MIDVAMVDKMFDGGQATGRPIVFALFDKRVLLSFEQLPDAVQRETSEIISPTELEERALAGWFPLLDHPDGGRGSPLFVPSRIGLYLQLARAGYAPVEIRALAGYEDGIIEHILTADELSYEDNDLDTLLTHTKETILAHEHGSTTDANGVVDRSEELALQRKYLAFFERLKRDGIPPQTAPKIAMHAYRVRAMNDVLRNMILDQDRSKIRAGYSSWVSVNSTSWSGANGDFQGSGIRWDGTIRSALAHIECDPEPPIRVPGFLLRGERIVSTQTFRPDHYRDAWTEHDIDGFLHAWSALKGERRCLNCVEPLPAETSPKKRFCSEKCRNALKQRRFRDQNPVAVDRARKKYWESVDVENDA